VACIATKSDVLCPRWVVRYRDGQARTAAHFRFCPQSGSEVTASLRVAMCQKRTHALQQRTSLKTSFKVINLLSVCFFE